jgi:hypothetical protein
MPRLPLRQTLLKVHPGTTGHLDWNSATRNGVLVTNKITNHIQCTLDLTRVSEKSLSTRLMSEIDIYWISELLLLCIEYLHRG